MPRGGVTRTVKEMERKGYLRKQTSAEDGRVTCISLTDAGRQLSQTYNTQFFQALGPLLDGLSEEDAPRRDPHRRRVLPRDVREEDFS